MKVVKSKDLPVRLKEIQNIAHQIAEQSFTQVWDISVQECNKISKSISGNDALSYFSTIIGDMVGRWICQMEKIAKADSAGISSEELVKGVINHILATINCEAEFEEEKPQELPGGIKRITL